MPADALAIERWPVERLLPYAANARTHSEEQIAQIAGSIAAFGFNVPCLVDQRGVLIAGHGRLLAARRLGLADVPVIRLEHLTDAQARAFRLADNQIALNAGWDDAMLSAEIGRLKEDGADLDLIGFGEDELDRLLSGLDDRKIADGEEDAIPEPPVDAITQPGDLWLLGKHRLLCGDSTRAADVENLLAGARPHLLVSDPPYGVEYDPTWRNSAGVSATARTGKVKNDDRADWRDAWALFPGDVAYVWHAGVHARTVAESLESSGFAIRSQIVWAKPRFVLSRGDYHWQHEPCFYAVRKGCTAHWQGARDKRSELLGQIRHMEKQVRTLRGQLAHIDGALGIIDPKGVPKDVKGKRIVSHVGYFGYKEIPRLCIQTLKDAAHPMTLREIAKALMTAKRLPPDAAIEGMIRTRAVQYLRAALKRGMVKRSENGTAALWAAL